MLRKKIYPYIFTLAALAFGLGSCTKGFDSLNQDPTRPTDVTPSEIITGVEKTASDIIYNNSVNGNLGMLYAQFYAQTQKENSSQYQLDEGSNNVLWNLYSSPLSNIAEIKRINSVTPDPGAQNENAIVDILSVWIYQVLTDVYGDVPYSEALAGSNNLTPVYNDAAGIYDSLLLKLDASIKDLDSAKPSFATGEIIYNGDINKWKKLANSLKLRIGIRMADASPAKSKKAVEEAVASGVMTSADDEAKFPYQPTVPDQFPFNEEDGTGIPNDFQVTETLVNFLKETQDPRLTIYARPATESDEYIGKPYGIGSFEGGFEGFSYPGTAVYSPTFPGYIMSYAEVEFALAEAAQRGYKVNGDAAQFYEAGVKASMTFWGVSDEDADAFLSLNPYQASKWRDVIGTQKWLALYNQGLQAWFERTRLKFKKPDGSPLFVAPANSLDPSVKMVPNRLTYPISEQSNNHENYSSAVQAIGGTDAKGIPLWWQK